MGVKVRAHKLGFWDNTRRRPGDEFVVPESFADTSKWWHRADAPPPAEALQDRGPTPPGNANAQHVPGSPADLRNQGGTSSAEQVIVAGSQAAAEEETRRTEKPKSKEPKGTGDQKVI